MPSINQQNALDAETTAIKKLMTRRWQPGDVYAPHDLSAAETRKWGKKNAPTTDPFDKLNINPLTLYKVRTLVDVPDRSPVDTIAELFRHVRIYDQRWTNQALQSYRFTARESTQGCEGYSKGDRAWSDAIDS